MRTIKQKYSFYLSALEAGFSKRAARLLVGAKSREQIAQWERMAERTSAPAEQRIEEYKYLVDQGFSDARIADVLGVTLRSVQRWKSAAGLTNPHVPARITQPEKMAFALRLLEDGAGYAEAARTTGLTERILTKAFPGMGVTHSDAAARRLLVDKLKQL